MNKELGMLLRLRDEGVVLKLVYQLSEELRADPTRIALTQALTLDDSRPLMGLRGTRGLFGSDEWWENILQGQIPLVFISGVIQRSYVAGQNTPGINNTVDLILNDGSLRSVGIYVADTADVHLFRKGHRVGVVYALDELKKQPAPGGGINYSKIALEMAVSLSAVS
jgi:hypothetical protein